MASVNKVILLGNLGADPEVRYLESGSVVANIRMATTEKYKNREGTLMENTEWHDIEMWDGLAKITEQYLKKGDPVYVEGKLKSDTWQDDQGNNRKKIKIRALQMQLLPKGSGSSGGGNMGGNTSNSGNTNATPPTSKAAEPPASSLPESSNEVDDLPF